MHTTYLVTFQKAFSSKFSFQFRITSRDVHSAKYFPNTIFSDEDVQRLGNEFADKYKATSRDDFEAKYFM